MANLLEKKGFRFLLESIISIVLIVVFVGCPSAVSDDATRVVMGQAAIGCWTMLGVLLFFVCFDLMAECNNFLLRFFRIVLLIVGTLEVVLLGIGTYLPCYQGNYQITPAMVGSSPWLQALVTFWVFDGVLTSYIIESGLFRRKRYILPFLPLLCGVPSYLLCVLCAYLGNLVGIFYWAPLVIAGFGGLTVVCLVIREGFVEFRSGRGKSGARSAAPSERLQSDDPAPHVSSDDRKEYKGDRPIQDAIFRFSRRAGSCVPNSLRNELQDFQAQVILLMKTCRIVYSGKFIYDANYIWSGEVEIKSEEDFKTTIENIVEETRKICDEICATYQGYDDVKWKIDTSGIKGGIKNLPTKKKEPWE